MRKHLPAILVFEALFKTKIDFEWEIGSSVVWDGFRKQLLRPKCYKRIQRVSEFLCSNRVFCFCFNRMICKILNNLQFSMLVLEVFVFQVLIILIHETVYTFLQAIFRGAMKGKLIVNSPLPPERIPNFQILYKDVWKLKSTLQSFLSVGVLEKFRYLYTIAFFPLFLCMCWLVKLIFGVACADLYSSK